MILRFQNEKYKVTPSQDYSVVLKAKIEGFEEIICLVKYDDDDGLHPLGCESEYNAYSAKDDKHIYVMYEGFQYVFDILPDESPFIDEFKVNDDSHEQVKSPMPGSIVKVLVKEGDIIEDGSPLIVIEAMKMETKLYASISGKVEKINCRVGQQVDSDLVLVEITKE